MQTLTTQQSARAGLGGREEAMMPQAQTGIIPSSFGTLWNLGAKGAFCAVNLAGEREVHYWIPRAEDSAPCWTSDSIDDVSDWELRYAYRDVGLCREAGAK